MSPQVLLESVRERPLWELATYGLLAYIAWQQVVYYQKTPKVTSVGFVPIPIIGSWVAAYRFMRDPFRLIQEGIKKTTNGMFRISTLQGEYVLVTDRNKVAEYLKAPDTVLNMQDGANDQQQIPYTMGYGVGHRTYHTPVVKGVITKKIPAMTPDMVDEASLAFDDLIGKPEEFTPIVLYEAIAMTVARVSNRVYVGTEFCRNEAFLKNASDYAGAVVVSAEILRLFPEWTKKFVKIVASRNRKGLADSITNLSFIVQILPVMKYRKAGERMLKDFIQARLDGLVDEQGKSPEDLVQWLADAAPPVEKTVPQLAERVMALNVASIHTTTMTFTGALYTLAQRFDEYAPELRKEILENLEDGKVTNATVTNLPKMESFLRESGRFNNAGLMAMQRNARKEFRFSDGTLLPVGSKVGAPSRILHYDPEIYDNPDEFDGFRFLDPKYHDSKERVPTSTTINFHVFGHGRHPCPGRFFATHEMKILLSLLLLRYDFELRDGEKPAPFYLATMAIPDTKLEVLFKKRGE